MQTGKLPSVRRVVTGHSGSGRAIISSDEGFATQEIPSGDASFALIWTTASVPADNNDPTDGRNRDAALTLIGGSVIRIVDMLPGSASPMHRSNSLDYGIVLSGAIELELDDGVRTLCGPGDIIVQRGTVHLWRNRSTTTACRIVFILIEATAYRHDGEPLPEIHP